MARDAGADEAEDRPLLMLARTIAAPDDDEAIRLLTATPTLAHAAIRVGASRNGSEDHFLDAIRHHVYRGDTALHVAAAAHRRAVAAALVGEGADVRAANRRGARPLHYAADGRPGSSHWQPAAQARTIAFLIESGAEPDALDRSGVAALHRAVRTRSADAVRALLDGGADPVLANGSGSTPLHLAVQNTGKGDSGTDAAREQQREIILLLLHHGARATDVDGKGKTVEERAGLSVRALLQSST